MELEKISEVINLHNVANTILGDEGFIFRKIETDTHVYYSASLNNYNLDRLQITIDKRNVDIVFAFTLRDKEYRNYLLNNFNGSGYRTYSFVHDVRVHIFGASHFKDFMLNDFEEFVEVYNNGGIMI